LKNLKESTWYHHPISSPHIITPYHHPISSPHVFTPGKDNYYSLEDTVAPLSNPETGDNVIVSISREVKLDLLGGTKHADCRVINT